MTFLPICRYADIGDCRYADIADIFIWEDFTSAISALKMFPDSRYGDIEKKCRYADIADADINIGTPLLHMGWIYCI